ncbi:MAG: preprotein translocase subunit SecA [Gammaproteobacteria bacterium]|nr:preprotein translocase subunit SecA [Gammaproteobacteria bacterium]MYG67961.1 preprotein translocase subunit SecA [Gammaproteobacteria bacterium]
MLQTVLKKVFGDRNQRMLNKMQNIVKRINGLEDAMRELDDTALCARTGEFRDRIKAGESIDDILPEAFAVVREASVRTLELRHYDVQLIGGMVLNDGKIAEMKTGEGKTLVATLPAYVNAVAGIPVHIVTVNDYLARRDAEWMGNIYSFLGLSVGVVVPGQSPDEKRSAYQSDIVYGTNNEFGFDYLRDNMAFSSEDRFQQGLGFAIVDEVDSILIDEARTPLIISGPAEESNELYQKINVVVPELVRQEEEDGPGHFSVDEKTRQISLTEDGHDRGEQLLVAEGLLEEGDSLYELGNISLMHHLYAALRAHNLFKRDVDYIVRDGQVVIIDEFTGRMMAGRRWSDGLHQAVEAKEGVTIQQENQTLASITFQNYFRLYDNLSGMTGTADTEAPEFLQIYGLEVVILPTNQPMIRDDQPDLVYRTAGEKFDAIVHGIQDCQKRNQPVLVGTASIDTSENLSGILSKLDIDHQVLNAKHHEREAEIIAEAGRPGRVTIATNMAGRGTDIVLGGNLEIELSRLDEDDHEPARKAWEDRHSQVLKAGGLHVLGTERNESRRVDNQLRGRCGRQGDPGSSRFYLSLEDNLMRIFGSGRISNLMQKLGMEDGEAIEHTWVTKAIENAQKKVEGHNFDIRKQLLEYDDVANEQRKVVYDQRNMLMATDDVSEYIQHNREESIQAVISRSVPPQTLEEQWDIGTLEQDLEREFGIALPVAQWLEEDDSLHEEPLRGKITGAIESMIADKESRVGPEAMRHFEKAVMLKILDEQWKEHLASMDHLRQGIGLRGYAQKNPKQEYKREAFEMFARLLDDVKYTVSTTLARLHIPTAEEIAEMEARQRELQRQQQQQAMKFIHADAAAVPEESAPPQPQAASGQPGAAVRRTQPASRQPVTRQGRKIGRNEPCPCGSGKKYKQCCGRIG